jgi:SAM-dependent methyltransferase
MNLLKEKPKLHSKQFQYYAILEKALLIASDSQIKPQAIGFGVGNEPIPSALIAIGFGVTATDYLDGEIAKDWLATGQLITSPKDLNARGIAEWGAFEENFLFKNMSMNEIPIEMNNSYDLVWSTCALGHIGSYQKGLDFIVRSAKLLKPGGWAIHTTELDLSEEKERFDTPNLSFYKLDDLAKLVRVLEEDGNIVMPLETNLWNDKSELFVASEPWGDKPHLRIRVLGREITSIAIILQRK